MGAFWERAGSGIIVAIGWIAKELWSIKKQRGQETFTLQLELKKLEHEVRFKKVYDKVSDNIVALFPRITKLNRDFRNLFQSDLQLPGTPPTEEQANTANESYNDAFNFLQENRLLIPTTIFRQVNAFLQAAKGIRIKFGSGLREEQRGKAQADYEDYWAKAQDDFKRLEPEYEKIHQVMQEFLGLDAGNQSGANQSFSRYGSFR